MASNEPEASKPHPQEGEPMNVKDEKKSVKELMAQMLEWEKEPGVEVGVGSKKLPKKVVGSYKGPSNSNASK